MAIKRNRKVKQYYSGKKVLVTGGAGFLGSHLAEFPFDDVADVHVVDNMERGRLENLSGIKDNVIFFELVLRDFNSCKKVTGNGHAGTD